jgi:DNA topoisomerase-1
LGRFPWVPLKTVKIYQPDPDDRSLGNADDRGVIALNSLWFKGDPEVLQRAAVEGVIVPADGHSIPWHRAVAEPEHVVIHEFGHVATEALEDWQGAVEEARAAAIANPELAPSGYALGGPPEYFAEAFANLLMGLARPDEAALIKGLLAPRTSTEGLDKFIETEHPRGEGGTSKGGQFVKKGEGGGAASKRMLGKIAGKGVSALGKFSREDYQVLTEGLKPNSEARQSWSAKVAAVGKTLPALLRGHLKEERDNAIHAAGALKALSTGEKPSVEQWRGLRNFGVRILLSSASMAVTGDPTGAVGHVAAELTQEIVTHVIGEHVVKLGAGFGRMMIGRDRDDFELEDYELLQAFIDDLAKAARDYAPILEGLDVFHETEHPRGEAGGAHGGEFVAKGSGGTKQGFIPHPGPEKAPEHIKALKIPPAWTDVHINPDPEGDLLAVGRDIKGREQRIYSPRFAGTQAEAKFNRIKELDQKFDGILAENVKAQKSPEPKTRDAADCLAVIMATGIRPGSETDTGAAKKAYGATTLEGRHVRTTPGGAVLKFVGKKGVNLSIDVRDPALAKMLVARAAKAGPNGKIFPAVTDSSLLRYTHSLDGGDFKTKDMRTLLGTKTAMQEVAKVKRPPATPTDYKKAVKKVAEVVAKKLGNTPTVALTSYIAPEIFGGWRMAVGL